MFQAFLEHNQPPDTSVAVPERDECAQTANEMQGHLQASPFPCRYTHRATFSFPPALARARLFPPADLIRQLFVIADGKPIFPCVACSGFQNKLQVLDKVPAELRFCAFNGLVNTAEVIDIFDDFKLNIKRSSQSANRDDLFCRFLFIQPLLIRPRKR